MLADGLEPGDDPSRTPALARLAAHGRAFENAFAPDPCSAASRASLLRPGSRSLAEIFRARGAGVAVVGPDESLGTDPGPADLRLPEPVDTAASASRLESWLRTRPGRFLALLSIGTRALADSRPVPANGALMPPLPRIAAGNLGFAERPGGTIRPPAWSAASRQRAETALLERSLAADRALDDLVKLVARAAPGSAIALLGDPPLDRGGHGLVTRPGLFEDTLRSTLVVATPGLSRPGRPSRRVVSTRDLLPSLLDLAGLRPEPDLDGRSLMPLLVNPSADWTDEALSSCARDAPRVGRSARSERWRYTEWPDGSTELYDHDTDPGENVNLARRPERRATVAALARAFEARSAAGQEDEAAPAAASRARPRNVLLVVVDDLNTRVGTWGAPVQTPSIDRLAAHGVRFERAYVPVAMCSPSRVSVLTGWGPERTGVWNNQDPPRPAGSVPLEEHFAAHGSFTAAIGKITHFPENFRWDVRQEHPALVEDERELLDEGKDEGLFVAAAGDDRDQPDGQRARRAVRLLEQVARRPFFLALGLVRPHTRWIAPARYFGLYPPASIRLAPYPPDDLADVPAIAVKTRPQPLPGLPLLGREPPGLVSDPATRREAIAAYQACTTFADAQVGLVLDALDRLDLWRETVVVLFGDNGFHLGEHGGLLRKDTLFEEALHVPLVVASPGVRPAVVRAPVELMDLYPTIVALAGLPPVPNLDARSLVALLQDPAAPGRRPALSYRRVQPPRRAYSIRTGRWRYTLWPDGSEELYGISGSDANENLAERSERAAEKAALRARLSALVLAAGLPDER